MRILLLSLLIFTILGCTKQPEKIPIKSVIITYFEPERQSFIQAGNFDKELPFPSGYAPILLDEKKSALLITTGIGTARSASSVMALGLDERFDLTNAMFILAGIAGGDPNDVSLGSVVFTDYTVDGDLSHSIDIRELDQAKFKYGVFPLDKTKEFDLPVSEPYKYNEYHKLPEKILQWGYSISKDLQLSPESESLKKKRAEYATYPNALRQPFITIGSNLSAQDFWHGNLKNNWANEWVRYFTSNEGEFMSSAMEDTGAMQSLVFLANAKKINKEKIILIRAVSDFTAQPEGMSAIDSLRGEITKYSGFEDSLANLAIVGMNLLNNSSK